MKKKNIRASLSGLVTFFLVFSFLIVSENQAFADRGVFNAKITPNEINIYRDSPVTVTAEIGSNNLYISSIKLYKVTIAGKPMSVIDSLYDNGTHGDETESDTVFTTQFNLNSNMSEDKYCVQVTTAYQGDRNRYLSPVMCVDIIKSSPENVNGINEFMSIVITTLNNNDNNGFLELLVEDEKTKNFDTVNTWTPEKMHSLSSNLSSATPLTITDRYAEYETHHPQPNGDVLLGIISFIKTEDGWRITRF
jgi:hypothetical protein